MQKEMKRDTKDVLAEFHARCEEEESQSRDLLYVDEYADGIHKYLKVIETQFMPQPGYMKKQKDVTEKMRAILIDWLIEVHLKFKLMPETLYLTVNLIDRYLEKVQVTR